MRIFLSSQNLGHYADKLVQLVGFNKKVIYIANARDDWEKSESELKTKEHQKQFEDLGFKFEKVDLQSYFEESSEKLSKKMESAGLVWVSGGNTFLLRRAMADSGLDNILKNLLATDKIAYGGSSAGSIVATPSLHGTEGGDDPAQVQKIYDKDIIWSGLGLVKFYFVPHYGSDWFNNEAKHMANYLKKQGLPYKTLSDGQVIIIDGDKEEFLK